MAVSNSDDSSIKKCTELKYCTFCLVCYWHKLNTDWLNGIQHDIYITIHSRGER